MKLHEVLQDESVLKGDMWFRPVSWNGKREAYCISFILRTQLVPTLYGGEDGMTSKLNELVEDWEIISAEDVLDGK